MNTESSNPRTEGLSKFSVSQVLDAMSFEDEVAVKAVVQARPQIAKAAAAVADCYQKGQSTLLVGAGTSGRLALMEAAEMVPTFGLKPQQFVGKIAGGRSDVPIEGAEDDVELARLDFESVPNVGCVIGISASGNAPYVLEVMRLAANLTTIGIANNKDSALLSISNIPVLLETGPEVVTGSTRLKAGTAQKMALNQITTAAMVLSERVSGNLMTHMTPTNTKLRNRAIKIVALKLNISESDALARLESAEWSLPNALNHIP